MTLTAISFLTFVAIYILLSWAYYLPYRSGQIYVAFVVTMLMGAYSSAYLARDMGWPFPLAFLTGVGIGALSSYVMGLFLARMRILQVNVATLALIFIAQTVVRNIDFLGGTVGMFHIPRVTYLLAFAWVVVVITGVFIYRLEHSRLGRALEVINVNEGLASSLGIDIRKSRLFIQTCSGILGAIAGVIYSFAINAIQPTAFGFGLLLSIICFVFIGGTTSLWGVVVFVPILWSIGIFLPPAIAAWKYCIYGIMLVAILTLRPQGAIDRPVLRVLNLQSRAWLRRLGVVRTIKEPRKLDK